MQRRGDRKYVTFGTRILAFLWDYVLIAGYLIVLVGMSYLAKPFLTPLFTANPLTAELAGFVCITFPVYLYFALCEGSASNATWGKRKRRIAVVGVNGQPIGLGRSLLRSALKFIPWELSHFTIWHTVLPSAYPESVISALFAAVYGLLLVYLLCAFMSKKKQTLYDMLAGTVVVRKEQLSVDLE